MYNKLYSFIKDFKITSFVFALIWGMNVLTIMELLVFRNKYPHLLSMVVSFLLIMFLIFYLRKKKIINQILTDPEKYNKKNGIVFWVHMVLSLALYLIYLVLAFGR